MECKKTKKQLTPTKMILFKDKIIKVLEESNLYYIGFDVFSESLYRVTKNNNAIELPEIVIKLIGCEKSRLRLADSLTSKRNTIAKLMGFNERSLYRCYKRNGMIADDKIDKHGKVSNKSSVLKFFDSDKKRKYVKKSKPIKK